MKKMSFTILALSSCASLIHAETVTPTITVTAGKYDCRNVPITVPIELPMQFSKVSLAKISGNVRSSLAQITRPSLMTEGKKASAGKVRRDLNFIIRFLKAGTSATIKCEISTTAKYPVDRSFQWKIVEKKTRSNEGGPSIDLQFRDEKSVRPILRYMKRVYQPTPKAARDKSYKVFHHMYNPAGTRFVTNGGHNNANAAKSKLLYPHHRGLAYGFNRITFGDGQRADCWHCQRNDCTVHLQTKSQEAGPVLGRHRTEIGWFGGKKVNFAKELREVTVWNVPGGTLVEWSSLLRTSDGKVKLDGDPQHAGFQFRAHNDLVTQKNNNNTYFLRVGGKGKPGGTINWNKKNPPKGTVDVPWKAMSFVLDGKRYTVAYLDHPQNPGQARHSERNYGRFGYYFEYTLTKDNPLLVTYRVWLQDGEMTGDQVSGLHRAFVDPPKVTVAK